MKIKVFDFETRPQDGTENSMTIDNVNINDKYDRGYSRVVTENGSYKIALIRDTFSQSNYNLHPEYQRRITWNTRKRSKLIESLIINIPIPPIFLYEYDYDKYEVMDGLQRISAIIDFYNNQYKLAGLDEWSELNGKRYNDLPDKVREGIDRRQIQVTTLLKESANSHDRADKIKRLVFERLNTGGVKLQGQEIRNAIYNGSGNQLCFMLSEVSQFRKLWDIPNPSTTDEFEDDIEDYDGQQMTTIDDEKLRLKLERHSLYKRMYDVELVLRFFAMRHVSSLNYALTDFLDDTLISMNKYSEVQLSELKSVFLSSIEKAYTLFGDYAFRYFDGSKWTAPAKMIYDPMMQVLSQDDLEFHNENVTANIEKLKEFYIVNLTLDNLLFDGKHQSKEEILKRMGILDVFLRSL